MNKEDQQEIFSKVPAVTFVFWVIKVLATTLGETGGDTLSMSMNLGYLLSTGIFSVIFVAAVIIQVRAKQFHPVIYWVTIVATTTVAVSYTHLVIDTRTHSVTNHWAIAPGEEASGIAIDVKRCV